MSLVHQHVAPRKPARVVIVAAGGFVGGAIHARLVKAGVDVLPLTRAEVDLREPDAGIKLAGRLRSDDYVVAAAAVAPVKNMEMFEANSRLVRNIVDALTARPVAHLLNIGSDAIYADSDRPLTEKSSTAPDSLHGIMHLFRDVALRGLPGVRYAALRPTLVYGARDPHNGYGPNRFRRLAQAGEPIVLFGDGEERRDHVLVDDVAELAWRIIAHASAGVLNAATGRVASFREIAEKVVRLAGSKSVVRGSLRQGPMPHNGYRPFDPSAVFEAFPDFNFTSLDEGLARVQSETAGN
jgi:nucleoside-diphosphate-sugar epimerase